VTVIALPMIALAAGFNMFAAANFWAACIDLAPSYSASLSALMNTMGSLGGVGLFDGHSGTRDASGLGPGSGCGSMDHPRFGTAVHDVNANRSTGNRRPH
jgi:hypothetical protein